MRKKVGNRQTLLFLRVIERSISEDNGCWKTRNWRWMLRQMLDQIRLDDKNTLAT